METWKLVLIGVLVFSPYFLRADLIGADPYYYLTQVCRPDYMPHGQDPNIFTALIPYIPCNIPFIKFLLLNLFLIDILLLNEIGKLFNKNYAGLLILLSPVLLLEAMRFENEAFALPLLLASLFYFLKWRVKYQDSKKQLEPPYGRNESEKWGEFAFWGAWIYLIAALGIWKGGIIYAFAFAWPWGLIPAFAYYLYDPGYIAAFIPDLTILEGLPFMILGGGLLFTGILAIPQKVKPQIWIFIALAILRVKFLVYALPFLVLGLETRIMDKYGKIPRFVWFIPFIWTITIFMAPPTAEDWNIVNTVLELHEETGKPVYNSWGRGYWYHYKGLDVNYFGWTDDSRIKCDCPGICVEKNEVFEC